MVVALDNLEQVLTAASASLTSLLKLTVDWPVAVRCHRWIDGTVTRVFLHNGMEIRTRFVPSPSTSTQATARER